MKNKVLIKLIVPELDSSFDIYIPVNEILWKIKKMLVKLLSDMTGVSFNSNLECFFINKDTCYVYGNNEVVIDTDIRNGTEIILISKM